MFSLCTSQVYYAKFPPQIEKRKVLLLLPVLGKWLQYFVLRRHVV